MGKNAFYNSLYFFTGAFMVTLQDINPRLFTPVFCILKYRVTIVEWDFYELTKNKNTTMDRKYIFY